MRLQPLLLYFSEHLAKAFLGGFLGKNYGLEVSFGGQPSMVHVNPHTKNVLLGFLFVSTHRYVKSFATLPKRCFVFHKTMNNEVL